MTHTDIAAVTSTEVAIGLGAGVTLMLYAMISGLVVSVRKRIRRRS